MDAAFWRTKQLQPAFYRHAEDLAQLYVDLGLAASDQLVLALADQAPRLPLDWLRMTR